MNSSIARKFMANTEPPYEDNATRFIFFNKAAIELARRLTPTPQILHLHDWAAALIPVYVHAHNLPFATVLTIHRLAEQGSFWGLEFALTNLPQRFFSLRGVEFFGRLNFLKGGIVFADHITTVSEHHKHEILRPEGGCGLDAVLRENAHKLSGILHGTDYVRWNPGTDPLLPARFDSEKLSGKMICRDAFLADCALRQPRVDRFLEWLRAWSREKGFGILTPLFDRCSRMMSALSFSATAIPGSKPLSPLLPGVIQHDSLIAAITMNGSHT